MSTCRHGLSLCFLCGFDAQEIAELARIGKSVDLEFDKFKTETVPSIEKARKRKGSKAKFRTQTPASRLKGKLKL